MPTKFEFDRFLSTFFSNPYQLCLLLCLFFLFCLSPSPHLVVWFGFAVFVVEPFVSVLPLPRPLSAPPPSIDTITNTVMTNNTTDAIRGDNNTNRCDDGVDDSSTGMVYGVWGLVEFGTNEWR